VPANWKLSWTRSRSSTTRRSCTAAAPGELRRRHAARPASRRCTTSSTARTACSARRASSPGSSPDDQIKPSERLLRSGLFGAWDDSEVTRDDRSGVRHAAGGTSVGVSLFEIWPNFGIQFWQRGWYHTYHHWPSRTTRRSSSATCTFAPARNARERVAHEMTAVTFKEFALQDDA
jgi:hypothetical protein